MRRVLEAYHMAVLVGGCLQLRSSDETRLEATTVVIEPVTCMSSTGHRHRQHQREHMISTGLVGTDVEDEQTKALPQSNKELIIGSTFN